MAETIKAGTILIKDGVLLPDTLQLESEPCATGWRLVKNLTGYGLGRKIHEAGWTFFCLASEIKAIVFGFAGQRTVRRATKRILWKLKSEKFNSVEITHVVTKRFLGLPYASVSARSRHIQQGIGGLVPAKDFVLRMPVAAPDSHLGSGGEQPHPEVTTKRYAATALISSS
jgi:hypothetical protein